MNVRALVLPLITLLAACPSTEPESSMGGVAGVSIDEIALYQGVKRTLILDGEEVDSDVPLIQGRDALLRVFVTANNDYDGGEVMGRLTLGDEVIEVTMERLRDESRDHLLDTTVNFTIDGSLIGPELDWSVEILQEVDEGDSGNPEARFPAEGSVRTAVDGRANRLRLVIAPFSYEFDGSGRLPDLSDEQVDRIRDRFLGMYPVSDVQIRVRDPQEWFGELQSNGDGWFGLGFQLLQMREDDGESDDAYYYGIFDPAESFGNYCFGGCLLGVTLLNDSPEDEGSVNLRLALGVGFPDQAADTAAHEIGHAHGRPHSPCGPSGNIPADIDPDYPYSDGTVGVWGYDITSGDLHEPDEATDFMGYCDNAWISDFTYGALHRRGRNVNADLSVQGSLSFDVYSVQGDQAEFVQTMGRQHPMSGHPVDVTRMTGGNPTTQLGHFVQWDHLPGGVLVVPHSELPVERLEATIDGRFVRLKTY